MHSHVKQPDCDLKKNHSLKHYSSYCKLKGPWLTILLLFFFKYAVAQDVHLSFSPEDLYSIAYNDTSAIMQSIDKAEILYTSQPDSAFNLFERMLQQSLKINFQHGIANASSGLAWAYQRKGAYEKSISLYQQTIPYYFLNNKAALIITCMDISADYGILNDFKQSLKYLQWAALLAEQYKIYANLDRIYNNIAAITNELDKGEQALYYLNKAEKYATQQNDSETLADVLINKGDAYTIISQGKGKYYYEAALAIAIRKNVPEAACTALMNLAGIYTANNQPEKALSYLLKIQLFSNKVNPYYINGANAQLGMTYLKLSNYTMAEHYLIRALDTAEHLGINRDLIALHVFLAQVYEHRGQYQLALSHQKAGFQLADSAAGQKKNADANQLEVKYRTAEKDKELMGKQLRIDRQESYLKEKNIWITGVSALSFLLAGLLLSLYRGRLHQKEIDQLKAMMNGEEKERTRIARELHDGIGGMLVSMIINLDTAQKEYTKHGDTGKLDDIMQLAVDTASEVRKTAHNLMPDVLIRYDLKKALELYIQGINAASKVTMELQVSGNTDQIDKSIELIVYRITQELIQNIVKHAHATHAVILLSCRNGKLNILVEDNGVGFNVHEKRGGYGLQNLKFRVRALQGKISIVSAKDRHTVVHIEFDLEKIKNNQ